MHMLPEAAVSRPMEARRKLAVRGDFYLVLDCQSGLSARTCPAQKFMSLLS
jgi:hypothetical protein